MRRETAFSPESAAGSSEAGSYRSPFALLRGEAQIVCGVLEVAYYRLQEMMGGLSPPESVTGF